MTWSVTVSNLSAEDLIQRLTDGYEGTYSEASAGTRLQFDACIEAVGDLMEDLRDINPLGERFYAHIGGNAKSNEHDPTQNYIQINVGQHN